MRLLDAMAKIKSLSELGKMVAAHHGWAAAKAFKAYQMDDGDRAKLAAAAFDIIKVFPDRPGSSAMISAAFAVRLQQSFDGPVQVVAGTLTVEGEPVFAGVSDFSPAALANGEAGWDTA